MITEFQFDADGFESLLVSAMGEGAVILSQKNDRGEAERVAIDVAQLQAALGALEQRQGH